MFKQAEPALRASPKTTTPSASGVDTARKALATTLASMETDCWPSRVNKVFIFAHASTTLTSRSKSLANGPRTQLTA